MKLKIVIITIFLSVNTLFGQTNDLPISISYFGQYFYQPGLKVGTTFQLKEIRNDDVKKRQLYISPQLGYFVQKNVNTGIMLNTDIGYKMQKTGRSLYSAFVIGLGYLNESTILSLTHNLGTGNVTEKDWQHTGYFVPTINYEFGGKLTSNLGWFGKVSGGTKLSFSTFSELVLFGEAGVIFNLK